MKIAILPIDSCLSIVMWSPGGPFCLPELLVLIIRVGSLIRDGIGSKNKVVLKFGSFFTEVLFVMKMIVNVRD